MQAATEKIRDVPAGAECHVAQFGYDEAQTQTRSTGRVRGEALRYMRHRKPRLQRGYERGQESGNGGKKAASNAKRYPLCENRRIPFTRNPPVSCLLGRCPNPRRTQSLCSETMDKSIGCAILQIAYGQAAQRCSASCSRRSFASSCSLSSSRMRSILALAVSSSFISSRAFR